MAPGCLQTLAGFASGSGSVGAPGGGGGGGAGGPPPPAVAPVPSYRAAPQETRHRALRQLSVAVNALARAPLAAGDPSAPGEAVREATALCLPVCGACCAPRARPHAAAPPQQPPRHGVARDARLHSRNNPLRRALFLLLANAVLTRLLVATQPTPDGLALLLDLLSDPLVAGQLLYNGLDARLYEFAVEARPCSSAAQRSDRNGLLASARRCSALTRMPPAAAAPPHRAARGGGGARGGGRRRGAPLLRRGAAQGEG